MNERTNTKTNKPGTNSEAPSRPVPSPLLDGDDTKRDRQTSISAGARGCAGDDSPDAQHFHPEDIAAHLQAHAGFRLARARALIRDCGAAAVNRAILDLPYLEHVQNPPGLLTRSAQDYRADADLPPAAPVAVDDSMDAETIAMWDDLSPRERAERAKFMRDFNRRYPEKRGKNQGIPVKYLRNY